MKLKWWLQPGHHETTRMQARDAGPSGKSGGSKASRGENVWFGCLVGLLLLVIAVGVVLSAIEGHGHLPGVGHRATHLVALTGSQLEGG